MVRNHTQMVRQAPSFLKLLHDYDVSLIICQRLISVSERKMGETDFVR
jgi:hypothetical protein